MFEFVDTFNREIQLDDLGPLRRLMPVMITHGKHTGKTGKIAGMWQKYVRIVEDNTSIEVHFLLFSVQKYFTVFYSCASLKLL